VVALVLLVGAGGGAAWYLRQDDAKAPTRVSTLPTCASPTPTSAPTTAPPPTTAVKLPAPGTVTVTVLNGTNRALLAKKVSDALAADGFRITRQGNANKSVVGASQVLYGPGASLQARTVSLWVRGSVVIPAPKASRGSVQLVLGSSYTRLATPAEAAAAQRAPVPTAAPVVTASAAPCRP
jgi:hypothetical protein